jgi:hypothetical protein
MSTRTKSEARIDIEMQLLQIETAMRELAQKIDPEDKTSLRTLASWVNDLADQAVNPR